MLYNLKKVLLLFVLLIETLLQCTCTSLSHLQSLEACLILSGVKENFIVTRHSGIRYDELNKQSNTLNGYVEPLVYLVPDSAPVIRKGIMCGKLSDTRVVAKSGGQSYIKNSFGDSNSMVIDLQNFNDISPDAGKMTCEIGSGQRVGAIGEILNKNGNYAVPVGICPTVGIGGFALGGGYGYLTREFGLASDNLVEVEMVDAHGELLIINDQTDKDLFWAIRGGGGGNFGIVTKFKFKMHDAPESVVYGRYHYPVDCFPDFFNSWQSLITSDLKNNIGTLLSISKERIRMEIFAFNLPNIYNETIGTTDIEGLLSSFAFPKHNTGFIELASYGDFLNMASYLFNTTDAFDGWKKTKSIYVSEVLDKNKIAELQVMLTAYLQFSELNIMQNGGAIDNFSRTETAFVHRNFLYDVQLQPFMKEGSEHPNLNADAAMIFFYNDIKKLSNHRESYQNFLDQDISDYLERYYQENLERLIQVKKRVDPQNVFHHPLSIPTSYK